MKKTALALVSVLALSMMLMAFAPVFARPYYVTIIVKDAAGDPVSGIYVMLVQPYGGGGVSAPDQTNSRGKVVLYANWLSPWGYANVRMSFDPALVTYETGSVDLNGQASGKAVLTWYGPV